MNSSYHLNQAIFQWQERNKTTALPTRVVASPEVIADLQRQGAIPRRMEVVYSQSQHPVLNVE